MHHKVKVLLSLVFISLAVAHAKRAEDAPSSDHRAKRETIKFGVKMKPLQERGAHHGFFEWKPSNAVGVQIGINPLNCNWSKFISSETYRSLAWESEDCSWSYKQEPPPCAISLRIYPDKYKKFCIYVSYIKEPTLSTDDAAPATDEVQGHYRSIFGVDYEFDWGLIVTFSANKGLGDVRSMLVKKETAGNTSKEPLAFKLSFGFNIAKLFW